MKHDKINKLARENRKKCNNLTREQRDELFKKGLEIIFNGNIPTPKPFGKYGLIYK